MKYRAEIDGLRALAVIPVILYHAGFKLFGGGYVGVDVFFVISGYLITTIILTELEAGTFSLIHFYERRARRILPALFVVMFACLPFAWFWLLPDAMKQFSESIVAASTFASNIFFWRTSGYFDTATQLKPLIHTWSLAVEEQYYILFPLFLMLTWKLGKPWILRLLAVAFVISLVGAQCLSATYPSFNFFMLPTRGWELLIGAFIAFYYARHNIKKHHPFIEQLGSLIGLLLITYSVFAYNDQTPFPSVYALAPTAGAALIITLATHKTIVGKLLGSKLFVAIGLISYSAYLWHQPMFAFVRERSFDEPSAYLMSVLALLSFAFAYLSWKYIERPFRNKHRISQRKVFTYGVLCSALFIGLGYYGYVSMKMLTAKIISSSNQIQSEKIITTKKIMLLGDSHAGHLASGLQKIYGDQIVVRSFSGCIPFHNLDRYDSRSKPGVCAKNINGELNIFESDNDYELIIFSTMGPVYLDATTFKGKNVARVTGLGVELIDNKAEKDRWNVFEIGMRNTLRKLSLIKGKKIIYVLDIPELGIEDKKCYAPKQFLTIASTRFGIGSEYSFDSCKQTRLDINERTNRYVIMVKNILADFPNVILFDPTSIFCDDEWCYGAKDGKKLYKDVDHLSEFGSDYFAKYFSPVIQDTLK